MEITINVSSILLVLGSAIVGLLGLMHLVYTFRTDAFEPWDKELSARMRQVHIVLTPDTTIWNAWIGFNASHGLGAVLFGAVYSHLALFHYDYLISSWFLVILSLSVLVGYVVLARLYWFSRPLIGIAVAAMLFAVAYATAY